MTFALPAKPAKTQAVAYIRVSTDKQDLSPTAQRDVIARWAELNAIKIIGTYEDVCSGSTPWVERPGLVEAVGVLKRAEATWLVVAKMDRLSRDLFNQLHLQKELAIYGARVIAATESPEDEITPEKQLMQNMLGSFAEFERAMTRGRIKAALAVRKAQGIRLGAVPLEDTELGRCIIWSVWHLKDQGLGAKRIAAELNRRGVVGPKGGKQHERSVQKILQRERPAEVPRAWRGLDKTFRAFRTFLVSTNDTSRQTNSDGNHTDSQKTRRTGCPPRGSLAALTEERIGNLSWGRTEVE